MSTLKQLHALFPDASTLSFDGSQYLQIDIPEGSRTQAEDVQLRFRTPRPGGLLLATTASEKAEGSYLVIGLEGGRLKIVINLGDKDKVRINAGCHRLGLGGLEK